MNTPLITIFGATGAQGGGLARALLSAPERAFRVRAVTRRPGGDEARALAALGAEIFPADLDDAAGVERAMHGAHGAFCVTDFWEHLSPEKEYVQAGHMAEAARRAGVQHVVWSTLEDTRRFVPADRSRLAVNLARHNVPHFDAKGEANAQFIERRLPLTLLYTSFNWESLFRFGMGPKRAANGRLVFALPMGDKPLPGIGAEDIGACVAQLFRLGDEVIGSSVGLAGEHLTAAEMARSMARALEEPIDCVALTPEQYARLGFPGAEDLGAMFRFKQDFNAPFRTLRSVAATRRLHPGVATFERWLARHRHELAVPAAAVAA